MSADRQYKLCPKCRSIYPATAKVCGLDRTELESSDAIVAGRYVKVRPLGQGGMGTVYEAWEPALKRRVALKLLNIGRDLWKYYEREAEALGRLADEHIVTVFERGHDEPYIAMEFLDGKSLDKHLAENGRIPLRTAFRLWRQAVRGVMIAHKAGIVHRDLKPANLFLTKRLDESGQPVDLVKILDFGIAILDDGEERRRANKGEQTRNIGTLGFVAPEQWQHGQATTASDVYSLGVVLLAMLTAKQSFAHPLRDIERVFSHLSTSPELLRLARDVLSDEPSQRPANAEVLLQSIGALPETRDPAHFWPDDPLSLPPSAISLGHRPALPQGKESRNHAATTAPASPALAVAAYRPPRPSGISLEQRAPSADKNKSPNSLVAAVPISPLAREHTTDGSLQALIVLDGSSSVLEAADSENETEEMRATRLPLPTPTTMPAAGAVLSTSPDEVSTDKIPQRNTETEQAASIADAAAKLAQLSKLQGARTLVMSGEPNGQAHAALTSGASAQRTLVEPTLLEEYPDNETILSGKADTRAPVSSGWNFLKNLRSRQLLDKQHRPLLVGVGVLLLLCLGLLVAALSSSPAPPAVVAVTPGPNQDGTKAAQPTQNPSEADSTKSPDTMDEKKPTTGLPTKPMVRPSANPNLKVRFFYCPGVKFDCGDRPIRALPSGARWGFEVKLRPSDVCTAERDGKTEQLTYPDVRKDAGQPDESGTYHIMRSTKSRLCL